MTKEDILTLKKSFVDLKRFSKGIVAKCFSAHLVDSAYFMGYFFVWERIPCWRPSGEMQLNVDRKPIFTCAHMPYYLVRSFIMRAQKKVLNKQNRRINNSKFLRKFKIFFEHLIFFCTSCNDPPGPSHGYLPEFSSYLRELE